ncbi:MAG: GGDEF domain-containing protein [Lachnospiraceae bacterium]|nr:GGDEF domain-containing protein [Candidatus Colinaster equi]
MQKESLRNKSNIAKYLILLYCSIIACCVIYIILFKYSPTQNTLGALCSVSMDIVCLVTALILAVNLAFEFGELSRSSRLFLYLLLGTLFALFFDFLTWSSDGSLDYANWTYIATTASLCSGSILAAILSLYLAAYMDEVYDMKAPRKSAKVCFICNTFSFILTFTLAITKTAFSLEGGHYSTGVLYDVITVIPILTLLYMTGYVVAHVKIIGIHDVLAVIAYLFTMITGAIIEAINGIGTSYVAIELADVIIYVMLQNKIVERIKIQQQTLTAKLNNQSKALESMADILDEEKKNVQKWIIRSNTDEITGFYNRHAYEDELIALSKQPLKDNFVYVSIDINGLKYVNDHMGHAAGDELIIGACECMDKTFGKYGKLYRTGGDEFAALIYADDLTLQTLKENLNLATATWKGTLVDRLTISCGYVTKEDATNLTLQQIAVLADKKMYEAKKQYYISNGIDRRNQ